MFRFVRVVAGSSYGFRTAFYEILDGILTLLDAGQSDGLVGNAEAAGLEYLTMAQAKEKVHQLNSEEPDHGYDGCHACMFSISIEDVSEKELPSNLGNFESLEMDHFPSHYKNTNARELVEIY